MHASEIASAFQPPSNKSKMLMFLLRMRTEVNRGNMNVKRHTDYKFIILLVAHIFLVSFKQKKNDISATLFYFALLYLCAAPLAFAACSLFHCATSNLSANRFKSFFSQKSLYALFCLCKRSDLRW